MKQSIFSLGLMALVVGCGGGDKTAEQTGTATDPLTSGTTGTTTGSTTGTSTGTTATTSFDWPATPGDYIPGHVTFLSGLTIPTPLTCCRDWGAVSKDFVNDGTNEKDNALAILNEVLGAFIDLQTTIDNTLELGDFVPLLDHYDLPATDGDYNLAFFRGGWAGTTDWAAASSGFGTYTVSDVNFVDGTGTPRARFGTANITGSRLTASNGTFEIAMPISDTSVLVLPLQDVSIEGDLYVMGNGANLGGGELSGYVNVDDFFVGYNQVVADLCGCAGLTGDLFTQDPVTGAWSGSCGDTSACTLPEEEGCFDLVDTEPLICPGIPLIITGVAADLDFDGDGVYEALSVGLQISGPPGEIVGISF